MWSRIKTYTQLGLTSNQIYPVNFTLRINEGIQLFLAIHNPWFRFTRRPAWLALGRNVEINEDLQPTGQEFIVELRYHIIQ